jgi:hypothetical protein
MIRSVKQELLLRNICPVPDLVISRLGKTGAIESDVHDFRILLRRHQNFLRGGSFGLRGITFLVWADREE